MFKIPDILYRHKKDAYFAYRPNGFSIGPWHCGKPYVEATKQIKEWFLNAVISRAQSEDPEGFLAALHWEVSLMEDRARKYAESFTMEKEEFVEMLVRDSCFIIELLSRYYLYPLNTNNTLLPSTLLVQYTYHDLILLENQIPWFVLESVCAKIKRARMPASLHELVLHLFRDAFPFGEMNEKGRIDDKIDHILDLLRKHMYVSCYKEPEQSLCATVMKGLVSRCLKPREEKKYKSQYDEEETVRITLAANPDVQSQLQIPSASILNEAGVKFRRTTSKPMLYVSFHQGVLELPRLVINDNTEALFRNLIAFEQCRWKVDTLVTSFAKLMDNLIDTVEDVHVLCKHGIICSSLDPEDVAHIFKRICINAYINRSYYRDIYMKINSYCKQRWPRWRAFYLHNYFGKPWAVVSQIFALLILTLSILQVVLKK